MATTLKVTDFRHGPKNARWFGARFDPASKTWTLSGKGEVEFWEKRNNPNTRARTAGLEVVSGYCPHYTVDQGCPLHGELCSPDDYEL